MWTFLLKPELDLILKYPIEFVGAGFMSFGFLQTLFLVSQWIEKEYEKYLAENPNSPILAPHN